MALVEYTYGLPTLLGSEYRRASITPKNNLARCPFFDIIALPPRFRGKIVS